MSLTNVMSDSVGTLADVALTIGTSQVVIPIAVSALDVAVKSAFLTTDGLAVDASALVRYALVIAGQVEVSITAAAAVVSVYRTVIAADR